MRRMLHASVVKVLVWALVLSLSGLFYFVQRYRSCETSIRDVVPKSAPDVPENIYRPSPKVQNRLDRLYYGCQSECVKGYRLRYNQTRSRYDYSRKANISVCSVPKAGSTLFTLVLLALEVPEGTDIDTIFQMQRSLVHAQSGRYLRKSYKQRWPARNVIVSRDPYRRLFSGYVDKEMLRLPKRDANSSKLICVNHMTFERFLSRIVSKGFRGGFIDRHFAPIALLCETCDVKYEFVAKQETLTEDITFLLQNMTVVPKHTRESILRILHGEVNAKTLIGVIDTLVKSASDTCSNLLDYISSLWTVFKIQGVIRGDTVFPREYLEQLPTVDASVITTVVQQAIAFHPLSIDDRNKQRREALVTAYAEVHLHTIRGIQDMYFKDFVLFDYDIQPPS